jgi:YidC/Oxa1 family membrane protein insertase
VQEGRFGFAGVDDHYFLTARREAESAVRVEYAAVTCRSRSSRKARTTSLVGALPAPVAATYFAGPKDFDVLAAVDRDLVRAIDFGMFAWLVVPLLRALKWINGYVGNYGWSLIILTILINLAMFPLRHKSVVSMRKMQDVQPEVKAIQDRYKN